MNPSRGRSWTTPGQISLTAPKQPARAIPAASKTASRSSVPLPNGMNTTANSSSPTSSASGSDSQLPDPKCFSRAYTTRTSSRWATLILNTNTETSQTAAIERRRGRLRTKAPQPLWIPRHRQQPRPRNPCPQATREERSVARLATTTSVADAWTPQWTFSRETGKVGLPLSSLPYPNICPPASSSLPSRWARKLQTSSLRSLVVTGSCERKAYAPLSLVSSFDT